MKKLLYLLPVLFLFACTKDNIKNNPVVVCADCTESTTGTFIEDAICATVADVDIYIKNLKEEGDKVGQHWTCTKH